jgi:hypothetical protein
MNNTLGDESVISAKYRKRRELSLYTRIFSLSSPIYIKRKFKKDLTCSRTIYLISVVLLMILFWFTGFLFEKQVQFPSVELLHEGDIVADINGLKITKVLLEHFNPLPSSNSIFIPLAEYLTLDQKPGDCVDENLSCKDSKDCEDLPNIFTPPLDELSSCQMIYKTKSKEKKGCTVHTWCPRQNPNKKHTSWIIYQNALDVIIITNCDKCGQDQSNVQKEKYSQIKQFPAKGANVFRVKDLLKASGLNLSQVQAIGTSINLWKRRSCFRILFSVSCTDELHLYPLEYYGQSLGYSEIKTNNQRTFKESRNEHQVIGVNLNFDMVFEVYDFSFLRLGLFFGFFYILDNFYKKIIYMKQTNK